MRAPRLVDLVGGDQNLLDVVDGLPEMALQLEHALAQPSEVVDQMADLGAGSGRPRRACARPCRICCITWMASISSDGETNTTCAR